MKHIRNTVYLEIYVKESKIWRRLSFWTKGAYPEKFQVFLPKGWTG